MIKNSCIDIGSNTLKIAYFDDGLKSLDFVLNLGLYCEDEKLNNDGINILLNTFDLLGKTFELFNAKVVATAVFRKISNANEIAQILFEKYGFRLKVLSQNEEAFYTRLGAKKGILGDFTLVDIGGYSIEISDENKQLLLDIGLLSFWQKYKNSNLTKAAKEVFAPFITNLKEFNQPIVLASKTAIYAKTLQNNSLDEFSLHAQKVSKKELFILRDFLLSESKEKIENLVGKNRDFAVLCGIYFIDAMFECDEFIISSYGLKEGILFNKIMAKKP